MVLVIDKGSVTDLTAERACGYAKLREGAEVYLKTNIMTAASCCTRIMQGEAAHFEIASARPMTVGTDEATTCIAALFLCRLTGMAHMLHLDHRSVKALQIETALEGFQHVEAYLVGAYCDVRSHGREICDLLLSKLERSPLHIVLQTFCCDKLNTGPYGAPRATSLVYDTRTNAVAQGHFAERGPGWFQRRYLAMLGESQINSSICSLNAKGLHVKGIAIDLTELQMRASCKLLTMPDDKLLHCTSTSPLHEDAGYAADMREYLRWQLQSSGECLAEECYEWQCKFEEWCLCSDL